MPRRPFNGSVVISQEYGVRAPGTRRGYHTGVDYALNVGTEVVAPTNGTIVRNGDGTAPSDGRGYFIVLKGDDGIFHQLFHLQKMGKVTGRVKEGQVIGYSGNTGFSSGPHLHWETTRADNRTSDFAPGTWLFAGKPVYIPPVVKKSYVRIFGDYRTVYANAGSGVKGRILPSRYGGFLDYAILARSGNYIKISTQSFGIGWVYVGPDVASLTQYYTK